MLTYDVAACPERRPPVIKRRGRAVTMTAATGDGTGNDVAWRRRHQCNAMPGSILARRWANYSFRVLHSATPIS